MDAAELDEAGVAELAGAEALPELLLEADDFVFFEEDFVDAVSEAAVAEAAPDPLASSEALVDFDFLVLADFAPESEAVESALASVEEAFADLDFFEVVPLALASAEPVASAFAFVDFFELVDLASAEAESFDDFADFLVLADLVSLAELSEDVDLVFFDFDADESDDLSLASGELASVDFFFLVVFFVELVLESVVSELCALAGDRLANPRPSPAEIRNAKMHFLSEIIPVCLPKAIARPCPDLFCGLGDAAAVG